MFAFHVSILVIGAFAKPFTANFGNAIFAISRLRFDGVS